MKTKFGKFFYSAALIVMSLVILKSNINAQFVHPGVLITKTELDSIKSKILQGKEPWLSAYNKMKTSSYASLNYTPKPWKVVECGSSSNPNYGCTDERENMIAAFTQALMWYFTKDSAYAKKAIQILNEWSGVVTDHINSNAPLQASWSSCTAPAAAEIIKYTYSGWNPDSIARFENMLRTAFIPDVRTNMATKNGNWELISIEARINMGVFLNDTTLFKEGLSMWRKRVPAYMYLTKDGSVPIGPPNGNKTTPSAILSYWYNLTTLVDGIGQETCRDFGHQMWGMTAAVEAAETAYKQGVDLYLEEAERITKSHEFHAQYITGVTPPSWLCGGNPSISSGAGWECFYNHYHNILGYSLPFSEKVIRQIRPTSPNYFIVWESLLYGKELKTVAPDAPTNLTAIAKSADRIDLTWIDNANNEENYKIERSIDNNNWQTIASVGTDETSYSNTGLSYNVKYYYRVTAVNSAGNSNYSNTIDILIHATIPKAPTNLSASTKSTSKINLIWDDNSNNEANFLMERSIDSTSWNPVATINADAALYSDTGLTIATKYYYKIRSENFYGNSSFSNIVSVTTLTKDIENLAYDKFVTFSSEQLDAGNMNPACNAVDGDVNTRWSASIYPQWIEVDLGSVMVINKTELVCYSDRAYQFTVDAKTTSDGEYKRVINSTSNTTPGTVALPITNIFDTTSARYVKLTITGCYGSTTTWSSISEFRVFYSNDPVSVANDESNEIPSDFELFQNYPNPFNPSTVISYQISTSSHVQLRIYDMLGREVATLVDEEKQPGFYKVNFNGQSAADNRQLTSGIYFAQLTSGKFIKTIKLLLIK